MTSDVKTVQRIDGVRSQYSKGGWYRPFRFVKGQDHSFSTVHEPSHTAFRNKVAPGYRGSADVEEAVDRQVKRLVDLIERKFVVRGTEPTKLMDIAAITHFFSLDVIGDTTFGEAFGFLDEGHDGYGFLRWNEEFFSVAATAATLPIVGKVMQFWPFSEALPKATDPVGLGRFIGYVFGHHGSTKLASAELC